MLPEPNVERPTLKVSELLLEESGLKLRVVAGSTGLDGVITSSRIQKPGLALLGAADYVHEGRIQVLGKSEAAFLRRLPEARQREVLLDIGSRRPACVLLTKGLLPPPALSAVGDELGLPILGTALLSSTLIDRLTHMLEDRLAPRTQLHGVLLDVYGLGVLIRGDSGIGKSEAALDLVVRGHRLVSDDVVRVRRIGNNVLIGAGPEALQHHMELRGLGIINIKDLFGVAAVRNEKALDLVVELARWDESERPVDRLGLETDRVEILDVGLPLLKMPVAPGRNMAILIEVATRNHLLAVRGYSAARELIRKIEQRKAEP